VLTSFLLWGLPADGSVTAVNSTPLFAEQPKHPRTPVVEVRCALASHLCLIIPASNFGGVECIGIAREVGSLARAQRTPLNFQASS
jgi:hypothetical protein